jgi:hypothetical protein
VQIPRRRRQIDRQILTLSILQNNVGLKLNYRFGVPLKQQLAADEVAISNSLRGDLMPCRLLICNFSCTVSPECKSHGGVAR